MIDASLLEILSFIGQDSRFQQSMCMQHASILFHGNQVDFLSDNTLTSVIVIQDTWLCSLTMVSDSFYISPFTRCKQI